MAAVVKSQYYPGWPNSYYVRTIKDYEEVCQWMRQNHCEEFLVSSGSSGYTFQVKSNLDWFILKWVHNG